IQVHFSKPVKVDTTRGTPRLTLSTGGGLNNAVVEYVPPAVNPGQASTTITFNYRVQPGQNTARLDYLFNAALDAPLGTITDANGVSLPATSLTLPEPRAGSGNSLAGTSNLRIVSSPAGTGVVNVSTTAAAGNYGVGAVIPIQVQFNNPVNVTGTPQLRLAAG